MERQLAIYNRLLKGLEEVFSPLGLTEAQKASIDLFHGCVMTTNEVYVAGLRCRYHSEGHGEPRRWVCHPYDEEVGLYRINANITIYFGPND